MWMMTYLPIWFKQMVCLPMHMMYRFHPVPEVLSNTSFKIQILCQFLALFLHNILYIQKHHVNPDGPASRSYHCLKSQNITSLNRFDKRSVELCQEKQSLFNSMPPGKFLWFFVVQKYYLSSQQIRSRSWSRSNLFAKVMRRWHSAVGNAWVAKSDSPWPGPPNWLGRNMRFPTMWYVRQAKVQISLRIRAVWSEPLLVAWIFYDC